MNRYMSLPFSVNGLFRVLNEIIDAPNQIIGSFSTRDISNNSNYNGRINFRHTRRKINIAHFWHGESARLLHLKWLYLDLPGSLTIKDWVLCSLAISVLLFWKRDANLFTSKHRCTMILLVFATSREGTARGYLRNTSQNANETFEI